MPPTRHTPTLLPKRRLCHSCGLRYSQHRGQLCRTCWGVGSTFEAEKQRVALKQQAAADLLAHATFAQPLPASIPHVEVIKGVEYEVWRPIV